MLWVGGALCSSRGSGVHGSAWALTQQCSERAKAVWAIDHEHFSNTLSCPPLRLPNEMDKAGVTVPVFMLMKTEAKAP